MRLFKTCALAGNILDLRVWTDFVHAANPKLDTFSSTTLHDIHIAQEAVRVRKLAVDHLRTCDNLTISYDGGTVKIVQSVYTVHVTEPRSHESYFLRGDESSGLSHTGEYIRDLVLGVMDEIGRARFACVVSDSTGSTKSAREQVQATVVTIIALGDAPHALNNLIKDICGLAHFSLCISNSRKMNKFVKLSSFATQRIKSQAQRDGVTRHLESAGKTRFAGVNRLGYSILRNLPSIKTLVDTGVLFSGPKERKNYSFLRVTSQYHEYDLTLRQLVAVLTPFAKAIKCLESSLIHPGHVYLFWLAAIATVHDVFTTSEDSLGFPPELIQHITGIVNDRFEAMCEGSDNTVYKAALFLDPVYILSKLWRTPGATGTLAGADLGAEVPFYREIGKYLLQVLLKHVESDRQVMQKRFGAPKAIAQAFQVQFSAYTRQEFPFNRDRSQGWRIYWSGLADNPDGRVIAFLAVKLLSMLPTSMPEERTMSAITKAESGGRSGMKAASLVAEVQVKQHYARLERAEKKPKRVVPRVQKFRELAAQIRAEVMSGPLDVFVHPASPSDANTNEESAPSEPADAADSVADELDALEDYESPSALRGLSFAIAEKVDIRSSVLLDLLSDVPCGKNKSQRLLEAEELPPTQDNDDELPIDAADFEFAL
ncbi:hypothetical protein EXIGLDRAFT_647914 [Exidia glandulosa HHB12029]|uniref:Uncharacterized protein n=1 Tax=Exidia glandulosa HHB12029 TaxID=1314781 RepID=A0A165HC75_EXIGL|nr:hypothetical protein EXIGLDRAFT_647914 [Exidia glandulosa HHB12029]